jgi:hypothetical protein
MPDLILPEEIPPHVRMSGYIYPVWPEPAGPKIATRRARRTEPTEQGVYGAGR